MTTTVEALEQIAAADVLLMACLKEEVRDRLILALDSLSAKFEGERA